MGQPEETSVSWVSVNERRPLPKASLLDFTLASERYWQMDYLLEISLFTVYATFRVQFTKTEIYSQRSDF
jgi:hypothetical protein